ncbi:DUF3866 family protein [Actinomyces sp. zg328]|uniref:DUF3866 family protein n=1 Tax=Actinomyces sp. zg328 TaxID=2609287 RepID=UPI00135C2920|nr:DUF3866 family protein [Actinomyces sp. zg328]
MMLRDAEIASLRRAWGAPGRRCAEFEARITAAPEGAAALVAGEFCRAVAYEALGGLPGPGERVRLEVSALARRLGTGGHAMVTARLDVLPADPAPGGHLVKARYMPDQVMVTGVDEQATEHHHVLAAPIGERALDGAPVVVADLHSSLPAILAGLRSPGAAPGPGPRAAYVMTDGGALPLPYSRAVSALVDAGWLAGTVTAGQAWGGDLEAVSVHNALLAARHVLGAEVIVVIQGPGNLGTGTPWGFSGVACGEAINAAAALGGHPVACLRMSQADARPRHLGVSHHSITAYGRVALAGADVVVPVGAPDPAGMEGFWARAREQAARVCGKRERGQQHRLVEARAEGLRETLEAMEAATGIRLSTMGRHLDADEAAFIAAAAAGRHAASLVTR